MITLRWPPAWLLVLIGLVLNILAILMSSIVLEALSGKMHDFDEQKQENLYSIQLAWNRVETLERKKELTLLYLAKREPSPIEPNASLVEQEFARQLNQWVGKTLPHLEVANMGEILAQIEQAQKGQREQIDDFYLHNLSLNEQLAQLDEQIAWYRSISLFLQVFGLALILARDLARK